MRRATFSTIAGSKPLAMISGSGLFFFYIFFDDWVEQIVRRKGILVGLVGFTGSRQQGA